MFRILEQTVDKCVLIIIEVSQRLEAFGATAAEITGSAQLGYYTSGGMTIVCASTDADAAAEVEIQLTGAVDQGGNDEDHALGAGVIRRERLEEVRQRQ